METTRGRAVAVGLAVVVLLGAAACSDDSDGDALPGTDEVGSQAVPNEPGSGSGSASGDRGRGGDGGEGRDAEALASSEAQLTASPLDETLVPLTLEVTRLQRSGDLVELEARLTNDDEEEGGTTFEAYSTFGGDYTLSETGLVDPDGQRMYLPVMDSEDVCVCSEMGEVAIPPGQSYVVTASFGGVPEDVGPVDLHFPQFPVITGLEIGG